MPISVVALAITVVRSYFTFVVDETKCARHQIQWYIHERTHGTFDELRWPAKNKYNNHRQSINMHESTLNEDMMDVIRRGFLESAR